MRSAADRDSLRQARAAWSSPKMKLLLEQSGVPAEVLRSYKALRQRGQDPDSALFFALDDWDLTLPENDQ